MCIKNKLLYVSIIVLIVFSCHGDYEKFSHRITIDNKELLALITEYGQANLGNHPDGKGIIIIDIIQWNNGFPPQDTLKMILYSDIHYIKGSFTPPTYYTMVENRPVLIYTGAETFISMEKEYIKEIEQAIFPFLNYYDPDKDPLDIPSNYSPMAYIATYVDGKLIELEK